MFGLVLGLPLARLAKLDGKEVALGGLGDDGEGGESLEGKSRAVGWALLDECGGQSEDGSRGESLRK